MRLTFTGTLKALIGIGLLGAAGAYLAPRGVGELWESSEEYSARERVRRVLEGLRTGAARQEAVCLWSTGTLISPDGPFDVAEDAFDAWARERDVASLQAFEIVSAERVPRDGPPGPGMADVVVTARIDGKVHRIFCPTGSRLVWMP